MTRFGITSLTWKYVPLSGKLPLIAVRHGICNKLGVSGKKAMLAYSSSTSSDFKGQQMPGPLTSSVPLTVCEFASLMPLHE